MIQSLQAILSHANLKLIWHFDKGCKTMVHRPITASRAIIHFPCVKHNTASGSKLVIKKIKSALMILTSFTVNSASGTCEQNSS